MSEFGTSRTSGDVRHQSANWAKADTLIQAAASNRDFMITGVSNHDGFEISNGGFDHRTRNDVAHVCKHLEGMLSHASQRAMAIHMQAMMQGLESERASLPARTVQG